MSVKAATRRWSARLLPPAVLLAFALGACSPTITLRAEDYDRTCAVDADCVLVQVGEVCNSDGMVCGCNFGAVSEKGREQHRRDFEQTWCSVERKQCAPCPPGPVPYCDEGTCALR